MAQNIKTLKIKRNVGTYASLTALTTAVKDPSFIKKPEIASMTDGELIMFRYLDESGNAATLMGTIYNPNDTTKEIHLEMSTAEIKELIKQGVGTNAKINVSSTDKVLELDSNGALSSTLSISREGNLVKLLGKKNTLIGSFSLPTEPSSGATTAAVSLNYKPDKAILQLIKDDDGSVISEIDFPFETMVQTSELTSDNKLKLVFNTTNGTQEVIVDINKLKDIYTSGDSTILVSGNKVSTRVSSKTSTFPITKVSDGLWIDDTSFKSQIKNITNRVANLETNTKYVPGDSTIDITDTKISAKVSAKATSLPITKEPDGLWVNDAKLTETIDELNSLKTKVSDLENVSGGNESNEPKNPTGVNLLIDDTIHFNSDPRIIEQLLGSNFYSILPVKPIILNRAEQVFTFSFDTKYLSSDMSGWLGIALEDDNGDAIPLTIFSEGNLDVQEAWSDDEDSPYQGVYLNLTKIETDLRRGNTSYDKLGKIFISFKFKDSNPHSVNSLVLYNNRRDEEQLYIESLADPILEFGTVPSDYSIKRLEFQTVKTGITNKIFSLENKIKKINENPTELPDVIDLGIF